MTFAIFSEIIINIKKERVEREREREREEER